MTVLRPELTTEEIMNLPGAGLYRAAYRMAQKLQGLTWADKEIGYQEWAYLVDKLNETADNMRRK